MTSHWYSKAFATSQNTLVNFACWSLSSQSWFSFTKGSRRAALPWPLSSVLTGAGSRHCCRPSTSRLSCPSGKSEQQLAYLSTLWFFKLFACIFLSHLDMMLWSQPLVVLAPVYIKGNRLRRGAAWWEVFKAAGLAQKASLWVTSPGAQWWHFLSSSPCRTEHGERGRRSSCWDTPGCGLWLDLWP